MGFSGWCWVRDGGIDLRRVVIGGLVGVFGGFVFCRSGFLGGTVLGIWLKTFVSGRVIIGL